jgi:hypothetical protein
MRNLLVVFIMGLIAILCLQGCWKQKDVISIKRDGTTTFQTEVVITEKDFSFTDIEELTSEFMALLQKAGWKIKKKWVSKSQPYKLRFSGQGNLRLVGNATDFYAIRRVNDNVLTIRFFPAESKGGKSTRSIKFDKPFFSGAKVLDEYGNEVKEIENVLDSQTYKVVLNEPNVTNQKTCWWWLGVIFVIGTLLFVAVKVIKGPRETVGKVQDGVAELGFPRAKFCTQCGAKNNQEALFCESCGEKLE